jgi:hypothetical protein
VQRSAHISACGNYRYSLERVWEPKQPSVLIIGLNPSAADAERDDPTLKRCIGFAKYWGYGGLVIGNLFAYRATDPRVLKQVADPIGLENDSWLARLREGTDRAVAAWGNHGSLYNRAQSVAGRLGRLYCLGCTTSGAPKHPLYVRATTQLVPWTA